MKLRPSPAFLLLFVLLAAVTHATIGPALQLQLGNPSGATTDPANRTRHLIQRPQYALDYNDTTRAPNWVAWNLTALDVGSSGRADFITDTSLPATFYRVTPADYTNSGYDRGHLCPSADRSVTTADNEVTFLMSNILPQAPDNNQGVWASFETYCRTLAAAGNEILITSGPSGFAGTSLASGVAIPGHVWKIAVVVPLGAGTALSRITSTTRVIALKIPNIQGVRSNPWQQYVTSAAQLETATGYRFFTDLPAAIAAELRTRVDGQNASGAPNITVHPAAQATIAGGSAAFSVSASGTAPLSYQWMKGDTEIAGATSATLALATVQAADAASYSVVVTNAAGSVASNAATLTVNPAATSNGAYWNFDNATAAALAPGVNASPLTLHNNNGTTATLTSVSVSGSYAGASGANNAGAAARTGALNIAAGGSAFFEFTLTPAAGHRLVVTGISFGARSTATGPQAYDIFTSADNYTTRIATGALANNSVWTRLTATFAPVTGAPGAAITIRIYGSAGTGNAGASTANWRIDDLSLDARAESTAPRRSYAGYYFGTIAAQSGVGAPSGGALALRINPDNTGVLLAFQRIAAFLGDLPAGGYIEHTRTYVSRNVVVEDDGIFNATGSAYVSSSVFRGGVGPVPAARLIISPGISIRGTIADTGTLTGTLDRSPFTANKSSDTGIALVAAGFYQAGTSGTSAQTLGIIGPNGELLALVHLADQLYAGTGSLGANGTAAISTPEQQTITLSFSAATGVLGVSLPGQSGSVPSFTGFPAGSPAAAAQRLVNLSTRTTAGTDDRVAIVGFVVSGLESKTVLVRAAGPTLRTFGVTAPLAAPRLELMRGGTSTPIAANTGWTTAANSAELAAAAASAGAFAFTAGSADSALLATLAPGSYTAIVTASDGRAGVGLVEVYDLTGDTKPQRLANLSTRALAGSGDDTLIAGVVVSGAAPKRVLIRAAGPALAQFGVSGVLTRPQLSLFHGGTVVATNAGWSTSLDRDAITEAAARTGAFAFGITSADAALLLNLAPGAYTAQVTGVASTTGIALIEIYEVP